MTVEESTMAQGAYDGRKIARLGLALVGVVGVSYAVSSYVMRPAPINVQTLGGASGQSVQQVVVQIGGAVRKPNVYTLTTETRVMEAIEKAGGRTRDAELSRINQAAKLIDGTVLHIPSVADADSNLCDPAYLIGAVRPSTLISPTRTSSGSSRSSNKTLPAPGSISLNTAGAAELDQLPGVGPVTAQKILEYRQQHGRFSSIDELLAVKGIGPKKLQAMRQYLRL